MRRLFSYVIDHDVGFAPNPFHGFCTVAACKPVIRKAAKVGDYVIGTGSAHNGLRNHLIYWMRVSEIMNFDDYWNDGRFSRKRPVMNGSRAQRHGDNIYHFDESGELLQEDSFHSKENGVRDQANYDTDTKRTHRVMVAEAFAYYGVGARLIPDELRYVIKAGIGHRSNFSDAEIEAFLHWLHADKATGYLGDPTDWPATESPKEKLAAA